MTDAHARPLWTPPRERVEQSNLTAFMREAAARWHREFHSYDDLYRWSVSEIEEFWQTVWDHAEIVHSESHTRVLSGRAMPGARWFEGARLNFARNLLRYDDDHTAIVSWREHRRPVYLTYKELHRQVAACAAGLKKLGVTTGDRVAGFVPNVPEAVIAMLAATSLGAVWSSCSPDFGIQGVMDRFGQIDPKVLIAADGYQYHGRSIDSLDQVKQIAERIPSLERIVVIDNLDRPSTDLPPRSMPWGDLLANDADTPDFVELPFDHPVYIMYSSGTTGIPKCMVHGAGGTLLQHYKEHVLHTDLRRGDVISYFTTCGWMMWNWLVSALQVGATVFLYDGSPGHEDMAVLWRAIQDERISIFGTSPKFLAKCQQYGLQPRTEFGLGSLRTILSTGSPLSAENFTWVYEQVKDDVQLASISGGTDLVSCFMLGNPNLPVYSEEIQCRGLGMKVEVYNDAGRPVLDEVGELVCTAPFPSMPIYFWDDDNGEKYRRAYFEKYPGVWRHGDYIRLTPRGGVIVYGRSDATLNPGGVRIGTAEIYNPVEAMPEIADSIVVAQQTGSDQRIVLFVVTSSGIMLDDDLRRKMRQVIRQAATPRHVPALILQVTEIPHTINGKKVELAVTDIIHGREVHNRDALANPDALNQFEHIPELQS
jgi:acetoacetyl-CoA synthetase